MALLQAPYEPERELFTVDGNAVVFAELGNVDKNNEKKGIRSIGRNGVVYGNIELWNDLEIPINDIPTILQGTALTIPKEIMLINNGAVIPENGFNITVLGTLSRNKTNGANER